MTPAVAPLPHTWRVTFWLVMLDLGVASALGWWTWWDAARRQDVSTPLPSLGLTALAWAVVTAGARLTLHVVTRRERTRDGRVAA